MRDSAAMRLSGLTVIYGGSFNPPHVGHQMACLYLLEALDAEAVWLMPASRHPFGKALVGFPERLEMCRLLAQPFAGRVEVSDIEGAAGATGRTFDTLACLAARHARRRFALAVGSDILREVNQWYRWSDIEAMAPIVVVGRAGYPEDRAGPVELPEVSSGAIRRRLVDGESIEGLVPARVADYIERQQLYCK